MQEMGYNPFQPHMSFAGSGSGPGVAGTGAGTVQDQGQGQDQRQSPRQQQTPVPSPQATPRSPPSYDVTSLEDDDPEAVSQLEEAFGMLLSVPAEESERVTTALSTADKMLTNLITKKGEQKFR